MVKSLVYPAESGLRKTNEVKSSDDYGQIYHLIECDKVI